jgi:hypothetical protein
MQILDEQQALATNNLTYFNNILQSADFTLIRAMCSLCLRNLEKEN